jgi:hypothetical protein
MNTNIRLALIKRITVIDVKHLARKVPILA